ncbi:Hemolin [Bienertia sinuspersici]
MDRTWITTKKLGDPEYEAGVMEFIKFALENNTEGRDKLPCPCYICQNLMYHKADVILNHLSKRQFDRTYTCWHRHGEKREETPSKDAQGHNTEGDRLEDMMSQFV